MGYDLYVSGRLERSRFLAWFSERRWYRVEGDLARYRNDDTGTEFSVERRAEQLVVAVPLVRPGTFALEAADELSQLLRTFGLQVRASRPEGMGEAWSSEAFLASWRSANRSACAGARVHDPAVLGHSLPAAAQEERWRWNLGLGALQERLGQTVYVPRIQVVETGGALRTAVVWGDAIPIVLPEVELLVLVRDALAGLGGPHPDFALATWDEVLPLLGAFERFDEPRPQFLVRPPTEELVRFFVERPPLAGRPHLVPAGQILDAEALAEA